MNSVVRIAMAFFAFVPLQRWLNAAALALFAFGAFVLFADDAKSTANGGFVVMLVAVILIGLAPAFVGGVALRFASTRSLLHLRPEGRLRLLLGATITITLLAALLALPFLLVSLDGAAIRDGAVRHATPTTMFYIGWVGLALTWIGTFALSRTMLVFGLIGLFPILGTHLFRLLLPVLPGPAWLLVIGVAAWVAFAAWYLRTDSIHRPNLPPFSLSTTGLEGSVLYRMMIRMGSTGARTRAQAAYEYMFGCASPLFFIAVGAWVALVFVVVSFISPDDNGRGPNPLLMMLPFFSFFHASLGFATARRARFLWLRMDTDRAGLFKRAERWGQRSAFSAWLVTAGTVVLYTLVTRRGLGPDLLPYIATQAMMSAALFYAGAGSVRGWTIDEWVVSVLVSLFFVAQGFLLGPLRPLGTGTHVAVLAAWTLVALLLRWRALHAWRALDWRVAKLSRFAMGG